MDFRKCEVFFPEWNVAPPVVRKRCPGSGLRRGKAHLPPLHAAFRLRLRLAAAPAAPLPPFAFAVEEPRCFPGQEDPICTLAFAPCGTALTKPLESLGPKMYFLPFRKWPKMHLCPLPAYMPGLNSLLVLFHFRFPLYISWLW